MRFRAKRWAVFTLSASAALLLLCALAVFLVDPFEHYRESSTSRFTIRKAITTPASPAITITTR